MAIKKIRISNFKSFKVLERELGNFNVLIGANASGKSNFIQIFKFLRDIGTDGLDNAIALQGGIEYLRNINIGRSENLSVGITSKQEFPFGIRIEKLIGMKPYEIVYKFALKFKARGPGFEISEDKLTLKCEVERLERQKKKIERKEILRQGEIIISNVNRKVHVDIKLPEGMPIETSEKLVKLPDGIEFPEDLKNKIRYDNSNQLLIFKGIMSQEVKNKLLNLSIDDTYKKAIEALFQKSSIDKDALFPFFRKQKLKPKTLLLETPFFFIPPWENIFSNTAIYDFDPKLPKKSTPPTGKADLEGDGNNLAIVLKNIIQNKEKKRKLSNLVRDLLPFVNDLNVKRSVDKSLLFNLQETYTKRHYLPAFLISDGTINITALIIALYLEEKPLTIIEEPERNIHPHLISKVVDMMKDASQKKQIIVTTHNPEMIKHVDLEDILLISRDKEGFSTISRPSEKEEIKTFLKNEIGVEELFVQDLLRV